MLIIDKTETRRPRLIDGMNGCIEAFLKMLINVRQAGKYLPAHSTNY